MTLSAYMELNGCQHPAVITKDLALLVYARDSKISAASRLIQEIVVIERRSHLHQNFTSSTSLKPLPPIFLIAKEGRDVRYIQRGKRKDGKGGCTALQHYSSGNSRKLNQYLANSYDQSIISNFSLGECVLYVHYIRQIHKLKIII